jgi:hypothetical protein
MDVRSLSARIEDSRHPVVHTFLHGGSSGGRGGGGLILAGRANAKSPCIRWKSELGCSVADLKDHAPGWQNPHAKVIMELNGRSKGAALWVATDERQLRRLSKR